MTNPTSKTRPRSTMTALPNEIAVRYRTGQQRQVSRALSPFGDLNPHPRQRIMILHRAAGVAAAAVNEVLENLRRNKLIDFATPVLLDRESRTRQVLTDEIVLRLKPGCSPGTLAALTAAHGVRIGRRNAFEPSQYIVKVRNPSGTQTLDIAHSLDRSDDVEFASPNFLTQVKR